MINSHYQYYRITLQDYQSAGQINYSENLTNIIEKFKNYESIQRIKLNNFNHRQTFNFHYVSVRKLKKNKGTYPPRK